MFSHRVGGAGPGIGQLETVHERAGLLPSLAPRARDPVKYRARTKEIRRQGADLMTQPHAEQGVDGRWIELERQAEQRQRLRWSLQHHVAVRCEDCRLLFPVPEGERQALTSCPSCRRARSMPASTTDAHRPKAVASNETRLSGRRPVSPTGAG